MSLFRGPMREHLNGQKELTEHKDLVVVEPAKEVYIPIFAGAATNPKVLVSVGDKVSSEQRLPSLMNVMSFLFFQVLAG